MTTSIDILAIAQASANDVDVCCDCCGALLGSASPEEWKTLSKELHFCNNAGCGIHGCGPDELRRVGKLVEAAAIERQWAINHGHLATCGTSDKEEAELIDCPF